MCTLRDILSGSNGLHPAEYDLTRARSRLRGCLAQAVNGVFYDAVANRRQPGWKKGGGQERNRESGGEMRGVTRGRGGGGGQWARRRGGGDGGGGKRSEGGVDQLGESQRFLKAGEIHKITNTVTEPKSRVKRQNKY